jgi:hypothetical protein
MLSALGRVYYNSVEQGDTGSLQKAIIQAGLEECKGRIIFGDRDTFDEMFAKMERNKCRFLVIDSRDYMNMTTEQYKKINERFPTRNIIIICWEGSAAQPKGEYAKAIRYMVDIVVHVRRGVAHIEGRYGPPAKYQIFQPIATPGDQIPLQL